jgi:hypothetical protein
MLIKVDDKTIAVTHNPAVTNENLVEDVVNEKMYEWYQCHSLAKHGRLRGDHWYFAAYEYSRVVRFMLQFNFFDNSDFEEEFDGSLRDKFEDYCENDSDYDFGSDGDDDEFETTTSSDEAEEQLQNWIGSMARLEAAARARAAAAQQQQPQAQQFPPLPVFNGDFAQLAVIQAELERRQRLGTLPPIPSHYPDSHFESPRHDLAGRHLQLLIEADMQKSFAGAQAPPKHPADKKAIEVKKEAKKETEKSVVAGKKKS